ncbi:hypothetical protein [Tuwongella immobilis]|uniref:Uncharacterized protein n=1 Tax=Tuwongella immobilis TaxID=692036 RepID=A0A6C2YQA7_9BACT|nr:hypothetical protein [Tuwongella immobilis]VIP03072.1 unnamed protein product [Tuwongella immobilis]VTS03303.1 unnamed protein product [Tuwongella immobilis]
MPSHLESLIARRDAVTLELANGDIHQPSNSIDGEQISWTEYRMSLIDELERLNILIRQASGPFMIRSRGRA